MTQFPFEVMDLLEEGHLAYLCTASDRNQPHVTPMFFIFDRESGEIYLLTPFRSKKIWNMKKNPQVSLAIEKLDPVNPANNTGVMVHGISAIDDSLARSAVGNKIYQQFEAKYPDMDKLGLAEDQVIVKIIPKKIVHWRGMKFTSTVPVEKRHTEGEVGISTITISRQVGSRGNEVAKRLCELLGYQYVSKEVIAETAYTMGITAQEFVDSSEDSYRFKGLLDRLLGRGETVATAETVVGREYYQRLKFDEELSLGVLRAVLTSLSRLGGVVIVGRGGQVLLRNHKNVFHVRIVAPKESRVKAIMERYGLNEDKAVQFIKDRDRAAAQYLKRFYGVDWDDPSLYDMRIDMGRMNVEDAAKAIAEAVKLGKNL